MQLGAGLWDTQGPVKKQFLGGHRKFMLLSLCCFTFSPPFRPVFRRVVC